MNSIFYCWRCQQWFKHITKSLNCKAPVSLLQIKMTSALVEQDDFLKSFTVEPVKRNDNSFTNKSFLVFITVPAHISKLGIERPMHGERFQSY